MVSETLVKEGDKVSKGDIVVILESMKMLNEIISEYDGVVTKVEIPGNVYVPVGHPLIEMES